MSENIDKIKILNEKLGISSKENLFNSAGLKSINDVLESSKRDFEKLCEDIAHQKQIVEQSEEVARNSVENLKPNAGNTYSIEKLEETSVSIASFTDTLQSMVTLINKGNDIIDKLYSAIVSTDILDPDLINSTASVIHSIRESNDNLIKYNMQKMTLEHQYKLAIDSEKQKQHHRIEIELLKHKLREEEIEHKHKLKIAEQESSKGDVVDVSSEGTKIWSQADIFEMMRKNES